jgi:hypothetical protein
MVEVQQIWAHGETVFDAASGAPLPEKFTGKSTAHDVAREESFGAGIHAGTLGRVEATEQTEVFEGNRHREE